MAVSAPRRDELLAAVIDHLAVHGLVDLSLRPLAAAIGTSHRMLLYHFGSKDELVLAVVQGVEAAQREVAATLAADQGLSPGDRMRAMWEQVSQSALAPHATLFFELYARGLRGEDPASALLEGDVLRWVEPMARDEHRRTGRPLRQTRTDTRLGLAVVRGLLLDLLATGERAAADAAFERYVTLWEAAAGRQP